MGRETYRLAHVAKINDTFYRFNLLAIYFRFTVLPFGFRVSRFYEIRTPISNDSEVLPTITTHREEIPNEYRYVTIFVQGTYPRVRPKTGRFEKLARNGFGLFLFTPF